MNLKPYISELVGTFLFAMIVGLGVMGQTEAIGLPLLAALTLMFLVYIFGGVSGGHFNPAVTISLAAIKKIKPIDAGIYIILQFLGALLALQMLLQVFGNEPSQIMNNATRTMVAEGLGAFVLTLGVGYAIKESNKNTSGLVIGMALLFGLILAGSMGSLAIANPALALMVGGLDNISFAYILAPIIGGCLGTYFYYHVSCDCGKKK